MNGDLKTKLLIGDNPFHGVSHLSRDRAIKRGKDVLQTTNGAEIVLNAFHHGADGFFFTTCDKTLAILNILKNKDLTIKPELFAIIPYSYEFVRLAVSLGGFPGLAKKLIKEIVLSMNIGAIMAGVTGVISLDPGRMFQAYSLYEISRIRKAIGDKFTISAIFTHEVLTDSALSLNMEWFFRSHILSMNKVNIRPGFHTSNIPLLKDRFEQWAIRDKSIIIATPVNGLGIQMNPSREECMVVLSQWKDTDLLLFGLLAGGLMTTDEGLSYINKFANVYAVAFGASKTEQAETTFSKANKYLDSK